VVLLTQSYLLEVAINVLRLRFRVEMYRNKKISQLFSDIFFQFLLNGGNLATAC
jgi:hypothetical protein